MVVIFEAQKLKDVATSENIKKLSLCSLGSLHCKFLICSKFFFISTAWSD